MKKKNPRFFVESSFNPEWLAYNPRMESKCKTNKVNVKQIK